MDDTFQIPNQKETVSKSLQNLDNPGFNTPDLIAMTDEDFNRQAYLESLGDYHKPASPQSIRAMIDAAQPQLDQQIESGIYNEGDTRWRRASIGVLENLELWREAKAASGGNFEELRSTENRGIMKKLFSSNQSPLPFKKTVTTRDLLRQEARIGGTLFGPVPEKGARQFFSLDSHSCIWYEEWLDAETQERKALTTRYEIRPNGVLKAQDSQPYHYVGPQEEHNLMKAVQLYYKYVMKEVYGQEVNIPLSA